MAALPSAASEMVTRWIPCSFWLTSWRQPWLGISPLSTTWARQTGLNFVFCGARGSRRS
jgi:hypothetical protein